MKPEEALKASKPEENQELKSIEGIFPKNMRTNEIKNERDEIQKYKKKNTQKHLKYETDRYLCRF